MKSTYETMGGKYQQNGNYLLPNLEVPECPQVGVWGERRRKYLREHQKVLYTGMMLSDTLNTHLKEVNRTATDNVSLLNLIVGRAASGIPPGSESHRCLRNVLHRTGNRTS